MHRQSVDDSSDNDQQGSAEHTIAASDAIDDWTSERKRTDSADLVHGRGDRCPRAVRSAMKFIKEGLVSCQTTKQTSVKSIDSLTEEA